MSGSPIEQLVANHWAERVEADDEEVLGFWSRALESFADSGVPRLSRAGQFKQLYDAARQGVVAFNAAHGYRARGAGNHHQHTFAAGVALAPEELKGMIGGMQVQRGLRHDLEYGAHREVSEGEVSRVRATVCALLNRLAEEIAASARRWPLVPRGSSAPGDRAGSRAKRSRTKVKRPGRGSEPLRVSGRGPRVLPRPGYGSCMAARPGRAERATCLAIGVCGPREAPTERGASMLERNPLKGPTPSKSVPEQDYPGVEDEMKPQADHGEESYEGSGRLEGLATIITGGDSGIGRAVAIAFAREGADVAIGYLDEKEDADAEETRRWVEKAGRRCIVHRFDVRESAQCDAFVERVAGEWGRLDVLVNNAAYQMSQEGLEEVTDEQIERTFRTNIFGYLYMARAALKHLKAGGVILNTGSITGMEGQPVLIDYASTKGAIHIFTKSLAQSVAEKGIRVNCVAPGPVWTPLIPSTFPREDVKEFGTDTYWKRPAQPVELAGAYVYLASAEARYVSGEVLAVTGKSSSR